MANFIIHNEEYESGYLEGVQENLALTSRAGFNSILVNSGMVKGDFEKDTIFTGDVSFNHRDPTSVSARGEQRFGLEEVIGVKVSYNTPKQVIPQADLARSNFSNESYSNILGKNVAQNEFKFVLNASINALKTALLSVDPLSLTPAGGAFDKKDLSAALRPLKDNAEEITGFLAARSLNFDMLDESIDRNRYGESGVVYGGGLGTLGLPVMASAVASLDDGTNQYLMALFQEAMTITLGSSAPSIIIRQNDDTENHYQTWSMDAAFNLKIKGFSYIGTGGNVTEALLTAGANWQQQGSDENLAGTITTYSSAVI